MPVSMARRVRTDQITTGTGRITSHAISNCHLRAATLAPIQQAIDVARYSKGDFMKTTRTSVGRLRLMKTKNLIPGLLLVGAMVTLLSVPLLAAGPAPQDQKLADTFSI